METEQPLTFRQRALDAAKHEAAKNPHDAGAAQSVNKLSELVDKERAENATPPPITKDANTLMLESQKDRDQQKEHLHNQVKAAVRGEKMPVITPKQAKSAQPSLEQSTTPAFDREKWEDEQLKGLHPSLKDEAKRRIREQDRRISIQARYDEWKKDKPYLKEVEPLASYLWANDKERKEFIDKNGNPNFDALYDVSCRARGLNPKDRKGDKPVVKPVKQAPIKSRPAETNYSLRETSFRESKSRESALRKTIRAAIDA